MGFCSTVENYDADIEITIVNLKNMKINTTSEVKKFCIKLRIQIVEINQNYNTEHNFKTSSF